MIRRPPRSTLDRSSAASDVYKRQPKTNLRFSAGSGFRTANIFAENAGLFASARQYNLSLIHISEPTRPY